MSTRWSSGLAGVLGLTGVGLCVASLAVAQPGAARSEAEVPEARELWGPSFGGERVFTKPKRDAAMGFSLSTQVLEIACRAGDRVVEGQLLVRGDDREEASRYQQQVHRAESVLQIERAQAAADLAEIEYKRNVEAFAGGGGNELEVDRSRLSMVTARIDVRIAEWSQEQERYLAELTRARVDRFRLNAPFDGVVDFVNVDLGDAVRETDPVVRVVDLSQIWIDVPTPPERILGLGLEPGSAAWVLIELTDRPVLARGEVIEVSPTSDFGASKQRVRVAVVNTGGWPSGLVAWVRFTEPGAEWRALLAEGGAGDGADGVALGAVEGGR